jgi:hypothetical protein
LSNVQQHQTSLTLSTMQLPATLITLALAGSASAFIEAGLAALPTITAAPLEGRDTAQDCARAITSLSAGLPRATDPGLASWISDYDNDHLESALSSIARTKAISDVNEVCSVLINPPPAPASLSSAASSYHSAASSWAVSATPAVSSIVSKCSGFGPSGLVKAGLELVVATDVAQCTNAMNDFNKAVSQSSASTATPGYLAAIAGVAGVAAVIALF